MNPLKVAVLGDLHVGSHADDIRRFSGLVDEINAWSPDLVLILGDFVHTPIRGRSLVTPTEIALVLKPLRPRLGTFAILGNHDWRYDGPAVWRSLEACNIVVLENSSHKIEDPLGVFWIVGLADDKTRQLDIECAFRDLPEAAPALVMAHDPATFESVPSGPFLTLCGHTHGGQVCLPWIGPLFNSSRAPLKWTSGYIVEDGRHLIVTRGLGTSLVPVRVNCPPELCLLSIGA